MKAFNKKPAKLSKQNKKARDELTKALKKVVVTKSEAMLQQTRIYFFAQALLCVFMQFLLISLALLQIYEEDLERIGTLMLNPFILLCRLFAAMILHLSLVQNVKAGLERMKFVINHEYLFANTFQAVFMPSLQYILIVIIETANMFLILESQQPLEVIGNFILLSILAEFDAMIYDSTGSQQLKKLYYEDVRERLLIVMHTSSSECDTDLLTDIKDEKGRFRPVKITLK